MSNYTYNLGASIERALMQVPSAQPAQVAAYWANREFWLKEFEHLLCVIDGYDDRLAKMKLAYSTYSRLAGGEYNRDEFGTPRQRIIDTASDKKRREDASGARTALKRMADRALDLSIATIEEYDGFLLELRITGR